MNEPIRILHVLGIMNRGGAETMIMNLYRNIDREKLQFDFVVHSNIEGAYDKEIRALGGKIYNIPRYNIKNHFKYVKAWRDLLQTHRNYKIIHGHVRSTASIYLKIAKKYGLYTISHSHSTSSRGNFLEKNIKNLFQIPIRYIADHFIGCSTEAGKWLFGKAIITSNKFFVLPNAIESQRFAYSKDKRSDIRNMLNLKNTDFVIGHVGSFTAPKNHKELIRIFNLIHTYDENSKLFLLGEGPLKNQIEKLVEKLGLSESVYFLGERSNVNDYMQAMDVFVMPSKFEGLPVTLIEAQASGLPCIVPWHITKEVIISNLITFVPKVSKSREWAEIIYSNRMHNRVDVSEVVEKFGYDIKESVRIMEKFYDEINQKFLEESN